MGFEDYFPIWDKLSASERSIITSSVSESTAARGEIVHNGSSDCIGLLVIRTGQLRAFILSDEGREITLYRLFERDMCLFSASCMLSSIQFDISVEAEKETDFWVIPADAYKKLMESSVAAANYTNQLMASRFSEVMWLVEQIMWKSFDSRLAGFLLDESALDGDRIGITHERIASHLGTAREVVTRMLKYFQNEGLVRLSRGAIEIEDRDGLEEIAGK